MTTLEDVFPSMLDTLNSKTPLLRFHLAYLKKNPAIFPPISKGVHSLYCCIPCGNTLPFFYLINRFAHGIFESPGAQGIETMGKTLMCLFSSCWPNPTLIVLNRIFFRTQKGFPEFFYPSEYFRNFYVFDTTHNSMSLKWLLFLLLLFQSILYFCDFWAAIVF